MIKYICLCIYFFLINRLLKNGGVKDTNEATTNIRKSMEAYFIRKRGAKLNRTEERGNFDSTWFLLNSWPKVAS